MNDLYALILRAVVGAGIAVLMMRMFYPEAPFRYTVLLWVFMVGTAYVLEYFRRKRK